MFKFLTYTIEYIFDDISTIGSNTDQLETKSQLIFSLTYVATYIYLSSQSSIIDVYLPVALFVAVRCSTFFSN